MPGIQRSNPVTRRTSNFETVVQDRLLDTASGGASYTDFLNSKQWTSNDGKKFYPSGLSVPELPAGVYEIGSGLQGIFFNKLDVKTEEILRFDDANSDKVITEIKLFWNQKEKFKEFGIPYKRGIILYGPPGTGKTCTIRLLINDLVKLNGIVIQCEDMVLCRAGLEIIRSIEKEKPIIVIMEDVDHYRGSQEQHLTNLLDGIENLENTVFLASTNYPEKLSQRVLNRPSRFDKRFFIDYPNAKSRKIYLEHLTKAMTVKPWTKKYPLERWVEDTQHMSIAHIKELFITTMILNNPYEEAVKTIKEMRIKLDSSEWDLKDPTKGDFGLAPTELRTRAIYADDDDDFEPEDY